MNTRQRDDRDGSLIALIGPTGSGKSAVIHSLGNEFPLTIISADSRQVVRGFDIGSGKPSAAERALFDYRLLDEINPGEKFNAFKFKSRAEEEIRNALGRGRLPIIVGGTGLYIRALMEGIVEIETPGPDISARLDRELDELGPEGLHRKLEQIDPLEAAQVHHNNVVRVRRALEIYYITGSSKSELTHNSALATPKYNIRLVALTPPIAETYDRINSRIDKMLADGWLDEVKNLIAMWGQDAIVSARAIGYNELTRSLQGQMSFDEAVALTKQNTRRYAKRQMTWIRGIAPSESYAETEPLSAAIRAALAHSISS